MPTSTSCLAVPVGGVAAPRRLECWTGRRWRLTGASRGDREVLGSAESRANDAGARLRPHRMRVHRCGRLKRLQGGRGPKETPPAMRRRRQAGEGGRGRPNAQKQGRRKCNFPRRTDLPHVTDLPPLLHHVRRLQGNCYCNTFKRNLNTAALGDARDGRESGASDQGRE